jgi:hypothetical protein
MVVRSNLKVLVRVRGGPLIEVKIEEENLTVQERRQFDALLDQDWEVLAEEEGRDVIILVLYDVVDNYRNCPVLVIVKSLVNGVPVIIFLLLFSAFVKFISVENGVFRREITFKFV